MILLVQAKWPLLSVRLHEAHVRASLMWMPTFRWGALFGHALPASQPQIWCDHNMGSLGSRTHQILPFE